MKPTFLIGAAVVAVLGAVAIAFAASGDNSGDSDKRNSQTPGIESPIPVEPDGGIGTTPDEKPIPVEPDGGIGTTPDEPIPVEPDGGIGDGAGPIPVEPDGGIGDTPVSDSDRPIPTEPIVPVMPADPDPTLPADRYAEFAPIDGLDLAIAESFPPQYFLHVQAGLPSGCAEQYTHSFTRHGNHIEVEVLNSFPREVGVCTAIYGMYEVNLALGSDFTSGETYTVRVNGGATELEFTAQ